MRRWSIAEPKRVEVIKGACLLLRRRSLDRVGLLDESYFMYSEELDLCYRLIRDGWQLWWVPTATVVHYGEASSRQVAEDMYIQLYRSKMQFYRKFGGDRQVARYRRLLRLAYAPRLAVAGAAGLLSPRHRTQAHTFRRLLSALPDL
jgi:GT2 family glycosyltransferase